MFSIPVGVLYRPNAAKVKNLKTKDYLGKARLVAQSDRNQSAEHNWRPMVIDKAALEDREGVSFAATNLVQKNLSSRTRQHSEPPLNRNVFPPTPPPEDRSTSNGSNPAGIIHNRSSSLRTARPPRLDLDRAGASLDRRPGPQENAPPPPPPSSEKPRIGTTRTASEPRGPSSRHQNLRGSGPDASRGWPREVGGHRRNLSDTNYQPGSDYAYTKPQLYSSPHSLSNAGWGLGGRHQPPQYIDEEDEYGSDECDGEPLHDGAFEIVGTAPGGSPVQQRRTRSPARYSRRANSRRPEVRRFRTKVHAPDDIRYIMVGPTVEYAEFEARIREKFGFQCPLKVKVKDEGDMITMVDQEDLDLLLISAREVARLEGSEMGKMEVRFKFIFSSLMYTDEVQVWVEEQTMI